MELINQPKTFDILFVPLSPIKETLESSYWQCVLGMMVVDDYTSAIAMAITDRIMTKTLLDAHGKAEVDH